ncbi:MAG: LysR family transcriptional regulator [Bryobacteraceae bacterium]|nr:LysR family transcriptional regulator [Bryobacteraceae bacterium]
MEIRQLELFLAVIEHSNLTKAAGRVNLSPGAVSLQLQNLATELRTDLFIRSGKGLSPTPAGQRLAERARELIRLVRDIEGEFANDPSVDTNPFHFATGATTLIHRLGEPLRLLRKEFPQTSLQVTVSATEEMVAGVLDRRFDLALISLPVDDSNLTILPLFEEELLVLRPSSKPIRAWQIESIKPAEIDQQPFLLYPPRSNMRVLIDGFFRGIGIQPQVVMEADDTEVIKRLVESGFGMAMLPEYALRTQPRFFRVFRVEGHRLCRRQALALARSTHPRALTRLIGRFLQSALSAKQ